MPGDVVVFFEFDDSRVDVKLRIWNGSYEPFLARLSQWNGIENLLDARRRLKAL